MATLPGHFLSPVAILGVFREPSEFSQQLHLGEEGALWSLGLLRTGDAEDPGRSHSSQATELGPQRGQPPVGAFLAIFGTLLLSCFIYFGAAYLLFGARHKLRARGLWFKVQEKTSQELEHVRFSFLLRPSRLGSPWCLTAAAPRSSREGKILTRA